MIKYSIRRIVSVVSRIRASSLRHSDETPNNKSPRRKRKARNKRPLFHRPVVPRSPISSRVKAAALAYDSELQSGQRLFVNRR